MRVLWRITPADMLTAAAHASHTKQTCAVIKARTLQHRGSTPSSLPFHVCVLEVFACECAHAEHSNNLQKRMGVI